MLILKIGVLYLSCVFFFLLPDHISLDAYDAIKESLSVLKTKTSL